MVKLPTVLIPIEVKPRELTAQVLVAWRLTAAGCRVYLGDHYSIRQLVECSGVTGGVYFDKGTLPLAETESIKARVPRLVILDAELSPAAPSLELGLPGRFYPGTLRLIDAYLVSGPKILDVVRRFSHELGARTLVTGWPRLDMWASPYSDIHKARAEQLRRYYGCFLLYASSFFFVTDKSVKHAEKSVISKEDARASLEAFRQAVSDIRRWDRDPSVPPIVVRPHPSESLRSWRAAVSGLTKTRVAFEGELSPWIQAAAGVVHPGSTSALEAYVGGMPTYFHELARDPRGMGLPARISCYRLPEGASAPNSEAPENDAGLRSAARDEFDGFFARPPRGAVEKIREVLMLHAGDPVPPFESVRRGGRVRPWLRNQRRSVGLVKWEVKWALGRTHIAPLRQTFPHGITSFDITNPLVAWGAHEETVARRLGRSLWCLEPRASQGVRHD